MSNGYSEELENEGNEAITLARRAKAEKDRADAELSAALDAYVRGEVTGEQLMAAYQIRGHAALAVDMAILSLYLIHAKSSGETERVAQYVKAAINTGEEWPELVGGE